MPALVSPSLGARLFPVVMVVAVLAGLLVGSFLNVVAYRAPRRLSVSTPRSFCPTCRHQLTWWENIPLVSWVVLGGRCHTCHAPISPRYPAVEAGTGIVFGLVTWAWHGTAPSLVFCLLAAGAGALVLVEVEGRHPPLGLAAVALAVVAVAAVVVTLVAHGVDTLVGLAAGVAGGAVVFAALRRIDPDGERPWDRGRAVVLVASAWVGGTQQGLPLASGAHHWAGPLWGVGAAAVIGALSALGRHVLLNGPAPAARAAGSGCAPAGCAPAGSAGSSAPSSCTGTGPCSGTGTGPGTCGTGTCGTGTCGTGTCGSCGAPDPGTHTATRHRRTVAAVVLGAPVVTSSLMAMVASLAAVRG
ncbi:MAG: prepilin peptidase [Acidimicrobiales bacterium]